MATLILPDTQWHPLLTTLTGSTVIRNYGSATVWVVVSATQPTTKDGFPILSNEVVSVENAGVQIWVRGNCSTPLWYGDQDDNIFRAYSVVDLPKDLYTNYSDVVGTKRIRVEVGEHSFFEGKEYRIFYELNIPSGQKATLKVVTTQDVILHQVDATLASGAMGFTTWAGGTDATPFTTPVSIFRKSTMSVTPVIASTTTITTGGSRTGGVKIDSVPVVTSGSRAGKTTIGTGASDQRGVGAGTYYWEFYNSSNETLTGVFHSYWEER